MLTKGRQYIQDAPDGPGELSELDYGKILVFRDNKFIAEDLSLPQSYYVGASLRIQSALDGPGELNSSSQGKALSWDDVSKKFVMAVVSAGDADTLDGIDSTGFLRVTGINTGATSQAQAFILGIGIPATGKLGINTLTPSYAYHQVLPDSVATDVAFRIGNTAATELITNLVNRDFSGAGSWTGTNWSISSGTLLHTTGSTVNAVLANANLTSLSIVNGRTYLVVFTVAGRTAGTVQMKLGAATSTAVSTNGTFNYNINAVADNADLIFTPTSTFDGSIDNISIIRIAGDVVVLNNGDVGIGISPGTTFDVAGHGGFGAGFPEVRVTTYSGPSAGAALFTGRRSFGAHGTHGQTLNGSTSFSLLGYGNDGTAFKELAILSMITDQDTTSTACGGLITISTTKKDTTTRTERMRLDSNGYIGFGVIPSSRVHIGGAISAAAWGLAGILQQNVTAIFTDTSTAVSGTATNAVVNSFGRPTLASTNATVTMTNSATVYIANSPLAGTNVTLTNKYALWVDDGDVRIDGNILVGQTGIPTAGIDILAGTTAQASLRMRVGVAPTTPNDGDFWNDGAITIFGENATTNSIVESLRVRRSSSGTPAIGFGIKWGAALKSATVANRDVGHISWKWTTATDATRASQGMLCAFYITTERECIAWGADASNPLLGFMGSTPVAKQVSGADLTNNVTSGGTSDTIANYTDLIIYANDAAAIRNDIYQLARKQKQINDALRLYGLLT